MVIFYGIDNNLNLYLFMSIYSVYPSILEGIPETHIQVDGIHGKGNCIEIFLENIIQSPCKVGKYTQMFEGTPVYTSLHAPGKLAQIIRKVVSGNGTVGEVYLSPVESPSRK